MGRGLHDRYREEEVIMPAIQEDMKFNFTDVGLIMAITRFLWAFGTIV
jgi:hypothetical protein